MASNEIEAVFSYIQSQDITLNKEEFKFLVETHPDYPSLLAFADALTFFNIPNMAFRLPFEEIAELPDSFIALIGKEHQEPNLVHITKKVNSFFYYESKKQIKTTEEELSYIWKDIVLLVEAPEVGTEDPKPKNFANFFIFTILAFILGAVYLFSHSFSLALFGLFPAIGLLLSIEALKTELGIESKVSQIFCNAIPNADCGQVINSTKNKWLQKFKISDISFWFFISQLLALFIFSVAGLSSQFLNYMLIGLVLSVPMTFYSVYFQYKVEKKWCPICLSIIGVVYLELSLLLFIKPNFKFDTKSLILFSLLFSIVAGLVYLLKPVFLEKKKLGEKYIKQLRFSRNYEVFKNTLLKSETQLFEKEYIILGNKESKHRISIVTSPLCGYCKDAHHTLDKIFSRFASGLAISVRFNFSETADENTKNLFLRLGEIYETQGDNNFMDALKNWFENKNFENWFAKYGTPENAEIIEEKLKEVTKENAEKGLNFTPNLFLNQYNFPKQYDRENLEYFIADWLEDEEL